MGMDIMDLWHEMGWFAKGIVWTLLIMSAYSTGIIIQKWWQMRKAQGETRKFAPEFSQFLEEDNLTEAIKLAEGYKKSHVARVLGGALGEIRRSRWPTSTRPSVPLSVKCS
jgi:biopolymer transport protein ExbB/biopolymer transport protein TolQ